MTQIQVCQRAKKLQSEHLIILILVIGKFPTFNTAAELLIKSAREKRNQSDSNLKISSTMLKCKK